MSALPQPWVQHAPEPHAEPPPPSALDVPLQGLTAQLVRTGAHASSPHLLLVGVDRGAGCSTVSAHAARQLAPGHGRVTWIRVEDQLARHFDPAGPPAADPQGVRHICMGSAECMALFRGPKVFEGSGWLRAEPLIIWDLPPITQSPAALLLAPHSQGVILVAQAGHTRKAVLRHAARQFEQVGVPVMGVVLNRTRNWIPDWLYRLI